MRVARQRTCVFTLKDVTGQWWGSCTSVVVGRPVSRRTSSTIFSPASRPGLRNDLPEVRLALSNDDLKTTGSESGEASAATPARFGWSG